MASTAATEAKKQPPTFASLSMSQATVTVTTTTRQFLLSRMPHKFVIHKAFICYYSPFFSAAFNGKFEEGGTQNMVLEDVDAQVFGILVHWLYSQEVTDDEKKTPDLVTCAKLWILGNRFLMRKLQNDAIKQIYAVLSSVRREEGSAVEFGEFCRIAANTKPEDNPLFKIAINMLSSDKRTFDKWVNEIPHSILVPVSKNLMLCREDLHWMKLPTPLEATWDVEGEYLLDELCEKKSA